MGKPSGCSSVAVVGAGAAGTLTAAQLARQAVAAGRPLELVLVDPRPDTGRGVAYSTQDHRHRLNVSAGRISAWPDRPDDFVAWLAQHAPEYEEPATFAPRALFGAYLRDGLDQALAAADGLVTLERVQDRVTGLVPLGRRWRVRIGADSTRYVDAAVLAIGSGPADDSWAPAALAHSSRFVGDPWAPGALAALQAGSGDVLLVGTGLTMVDVAVSLAGPARTIHAVSRHGLLPGAHLDALVQPVAPPAIPDGDLSLDALVGLVREHVRSTTRATGDWRCAIDSLRPLNPVLWQRLSDSDRAKFVAGTARSWEVRRHRMAAPVAREIGRLRHDGRLSITAASVNTVLETEQGLEVTLSDGRCLQVGAVVNCTGPSDRLTRRGGALLLDLATNDRVTSGPLGLGLATDGSGRVVGADGTVQAGLWTLGSTRRGELYESTAIPEIRTQARDLAATLLDELASPQSGRRPRDRYGLAMSASPEAAIAYGTALEALLRVQSGAEISLQHAATVDPGFALAHAGLALLGHEWGAAVDVKASLEAAVHAVAVRGDERERSFVAAVQARILRPGPEASAQLLAHIRHYSEDALAVSIAVPTIAFGGATEVPQEAWSLVESLAPAYGSDWWYAGLLAFIRQEQERWDEAVELSERALAEVPTSGHAVHARTHVFYETGQHDAGLDFLDPWIDTSGRAASHRAHFAWHAALHELAVGDDVAVRRRYAAQLAPPAVSGMRALVDSASLLWRGRLAGAWGDEDPPVQAVLEVVDADLLNRPRTAFATLHVAVARAASRDAAALTALRAHSAASPDPVMQGVVVQVVGGLLQLLTGQASAAADTLQQSLVNLWRVGGSAAQRDVIEDTLLYAYIEAGRCEAARSLLSRRLDRRPSPREQARLALLETANR
ncbi:MAG: FAD/NAD(P)-binding protein [Actinomycetales bacterium]